MATLSTCPTCGFPLPEGSPGGTVTCASCRAQVNLSGGGAGVPGAGGRPAVRSVPSAAPAARVVEVPGNSGPVIDLSGGTAAGGDPGRRPGAAARSGGRRVPAAKGVPVWVYSAGGLGILVVILLLSRLGGSPRRIADSEYSAEAKRQVVEQYQNRKRLSPAEKEQVLRLIDKHHEECFRKAFKRSADGTGQFDGKEYRALIKHKIEHGLPYSMLQKLR